ncbi:hypothetical protein Acr_18g0008830 [Actinidia rufa]|uniref:RNase H type-1 domain-containing protein n=1 Tax=Actinidia rufa TaxID=165716 RepID=A0A7J0G7E6_9ERIC|nr:hypothetical protein Acr_18g0008830 [Actinidia rufa]
MHLHSRLLSRPSTSNPLDNRAHSMANTSQTTNLEGIIHREMHGIAEQINITIVINDRRIKDLDTRIDAINTGANARITVDSLIRKTEPPFTERVIRVKVSSIFKLPSQLGVYEGKTDPMDHLNSYKNLMMLWGYSDEKYEESLKDYVKHFNQVVLEVEDPSDKSKADKSIAKEELVKAKHRRRGRDDHKRKETDTRRIDYMGEMKRDMLIIDQQQVMSQQSMEGLDQGDVLVHLGKGMPERQVGEQKSIRQDEDRRDRLHPFHTPLVRFGGSSISPLGWIKLPLTFVSEPHLTTAITSTYHLMMKSPMSTGVGEIDDAEMEVLRDEMEDMPLIVPQDTENTKPLPRSSSSSPKKRKFTPERWKVIKEEEAKLIKANVIRESHYPDWLANVIVGPKKGRKWRACIDFTDLNKACPKGSFSLPKIDLIIDSNSKHELLSFMYAFSRYYQIKMYPPNIEKTSFIIERGLYCYMVMPFRRDMLVKSLRVVDHIAHIKEALGILQKLHMMLNPSKCILDVSSGKFFCFLVSKQGIEANPDQIQALLTMSSPRNIHEWSIELSEFHISYRPRMAIKDQALSDFTYDVAPSPEIKVSEEQNQDNDLAKWKLFVDKLANQHGCGAGLVLQTSSGEQMEYAIRIGFKATNNKAKYEALLAGLRVTTELGVESLDAYSDSQLIINQVQGDYLAKDFQLMAYLDEVNAMSTKIRDSKFAKFLEKRTRRLMPWLT